MSLPGRLWSGILDLFLPVRCLFCNSVVETYRWNLPLCQEDYQQLPRLTGPVCRICGLPLGNEVFELGCDLYDDPAPACGDCRRRTNRLEFTLAPYAYNGKMRRLIHRWKFGREEKWGKIFGHLLAESLPVVLPGGNWDSFVPIPLTEIRREERGFNQSRQLAEALENKYELPVELLLDKNLQTPAQSLLDREERLNNLEDSFICSPEKKIANKNLIIVDDIYTTGTTLREAAQTLKEAGAQNTGAIVLARSLPAGPDFNQSPPEEDWLPL
ncbi:MAG: phosphoribosyltransferase family protein [bacterium]